MLKYQQVQLALWNLFNTYFEFGVVPSIWLKSVILPIPKSSKKDPYTPLNYRGLSLLSCVAKLYSAVLNDRITSYCDMLNIVVDEQNGFRKGRSCEDHIFPLCSIIRNNLEQSKGTYCAFIDLEKAFDHIDRDLLMHRLLYYNIDGKMYNAIRSLYRGTECSVKLNDTLFSEKF